MILRTHRFHGYNSLRFVYANGKTTRATHLAIRTALNPQRSTYRCAVVVSKKVSKSAVVRNRIRRRIYELVRAQQSNIQAPLDLVVTVYSDQIATMPAGELNTTFSKLLVTAGVIK